MLLTPFLKAQYQDVEGGQFGLALQRTYYAGDDVITLFGIKGLQEAGLFLEPNTASVILQPVIRHANFGAAQTSWSGTGALWREQLDHSSNKLTSVQYSGVENLAEWAVESSSSILALDNQGFSLELYLGSPPKATTTRKSTDIYRQVSWPSDSVDGENRYRATLPYGEAPYLEKSTDAGATWKRITTFDGVSADVRNAKNARVALTCMVIDDEMIVWLGTQDFARGAFIDRDGGFKAGKIKVSGKGGYTSVGLGLIRYKNTGYFISPDHFGPLDMHTPTPDFYFYCTKSADLTAASQTIVGAAEDIDELNTTFSYRVTMTSPSMGGSDSDVSATTPWLKEITIIWPLIYNPPVDGGWVDFTPNGYAQVIDFNPSERVLRRENKVILRAYAGERNPAHGVEALKVWIGYKHKLDNGDYGSEPGVLQGLFVSNTEARFFTSGRDSFVTYDGHDLLWFLEPQSLPQQVFFSRWCPHALIRLLLEMGGIIPDFYQTLAKDDGGVDFCAFGPNPENCSHPKMPVREPFEANTPILECIDLVKELMYFWYGTDAAGQFRCEPFDPDTFTDVIKAFTEQGTGDGSNYDEIGVPGEPPFLERTRSVSGVKNEISFAGIDQVTGGLVFASYQDSDSINTRNASNYTAGIRSFTLASSLFVDQIFAEDALNKVKKWARLPYEAVTFNANGQPELWPSVESGGVISVNELRTLGGDDVKYILLRVETTFQAPGKLTSMLTGIWNGQDTAPGTGGA